MAFTTTALGLEELRQGKGLSLHQIAESTKIGIFFLKAIETGQFAKLPGGVFNRSYIRQYATAVGISDRQLLEAYARYEADQIASEQAAVATTRPSGLRWISSLLALIGG